MDRGQLRDRLRSAYLDDTAEPYLWADDLLNELIEESQQEAVLRSRMLVANIELPLVAGQGRYPLPVGTLDIARMRVPGAPSLRRTSVDELDESGSWEQRQGRPTHYAFTSIQLAGDGDLIVYPAPAGAVVARLAIQRLPAVLAQDSDEPELPGHMHLFILEWAAHRAFSLRDSDSEDEARAAKHAAEFSRVFGERLNASALRKRADKRPHRTKINSSWR